MSNPVANLQLSVRYRLGCGRRAELAREAQALRIERPLVVTDPGVAAQPWFADMIQGARAAGLSPTVFDGVRSNPVLANVHAGLTAYRQDDHDGLVLIGGGSAMDTGKAIALAVGHDAPLFEYEFLLGRRFKSIRADSVPPMLAMPTTSGSGSEMSAGAVITDSDAGVKRTLLHPSLTPGAVIADPEVTFGLPAILTAGTGMDALTHAFEAYCAPGYNPIADGVALEAMRLVGSSLPRAVAEPTDADARTHMMMAASMAAVAFQKGLGLVHAMAHPLGAVTDIHHGLANAILLPYVAHFNRDAIAERMELLARHLGTAEPGLAGVMTWILKLREAVGIPHRLADVASVDTDGLATALAPKAAAEKAYLMTNPTRCSESDIEAVYTAAITGSL
jgi:alcohol dehydrogenase class IV